MRKNLNKRAGGGRTQSFGGLVRDCPRGERANLGDLTGLLGKPALSSAGPRQLQAA